jgi:exodeoxyribonuclease VII large subunit
LADNPYGFKFETQLFPATMQGEGVEQSIINALERIYDTDYDCVVIIRGGGATSDMSGFDTLALAENVANFPIPIITGIGHERDESILDMVSHTRVKTPTAAAAFLIEHLKEVLDVIDSSQDRITRYAQQKLTTLNSQLAIVSESIPRLFSLVKTRQESKLDIFEQRMRTSIDRRLTSESHKLELISEKLKALDPTLLLARGYSITMHNGHAVRDASTLPPGTEIETRLAKGTIHSIIK